MAKSPNPLLFPSSTGDPQVVSLAWKGQGEKCFPFLIPLLSLPWHKLCAPRPLEPLDLKVYNNLNISIFFSFIIARTSPPKEGPEMQWEKGQHKDST